MSFEFSHDDAGVDGDRGGCCAEFAGLPVELARRSEVVTVAVIPSPIRDLRPFSAPHFCDVLSERRSRLPLTGRGDPDALP